MTTKKSTAQQSSKIRRDILRHAAAIEKELLAEPSGSLRVAFDKFADAQLVWFAAKAAFEEAKNAHYAHNKVAETFWTTKP